MIAASMTARCLHIHRSGIRCIHETFGSTDFCETHQRVVAFTSNRLQYSWVRKAVVRVVALVVLAIMFLIPLLYSLKNLSSAVPAEAREAW